MNTIQRAIQRWFYIQSLWSNTWNIAERIREALLIKILNLFFILPETVQTIFLMVLKFIKWLLLCFWVPVILGYIIGFASWIFFGRWDYTVMFFSSRPASEDYGYFYRYLQIVGISFITTLLVGGLGWSILTLVQGIIEVIQIKLRDMYNNALIYKNKKLRPIWYKNREK